MYQIKCDEYVLHDLRDPDLVLLDPKCSLAVNTVGSASFTILKSHPYFEKLNKLKSVVEINDGIQVIFRGRITNDTRDFYNKTKVDIEGALAYTNDTLIPPFNFPDDFTLPTNKNVIEVLLEWIIAQHNSHVSDFQKLKLGNVTVSDPNNVIVRSSEKYLSTWEVLKTRLFESALGGYMYARYEADGTYIDYVSDFTLTNTQTVEISENMLDLKHDVDASATYSACLPMGAEIEVPAETNADGDVVVDGYRYNLTLKDLPDGHLSSDIVKTGLYIYSKSAVSKYGWVCAPIADTTWTDVTEVDNLKRKSMAWLGNVGMMLKDTITITAVDLNLTDDEIQTFRPYRNIQVNSAPHGLAGAVYKLTDIDLDLQNPQNTKITIGEVKKTLVEEMMNSTSEAIERAEKSAIIADSVNKKVDAETQAIRQQFLSQETSIISTCEAIIFGALAQYVETGNFDEFKRTTESALSIMSDTISLQFSQTNSMIQNVNGDLQQQSNTLSKYFDFGVDGLTIKSGANQMTLTLDNDKISFKKNGEEFGWWDGVDFHTGNIIIDVTERAQLGNFAYIPRSDGSLMFLKVR